MGPGLARYCTMTSSAALALRASYLTSVVTSWVLAVRCGLLGNSAVNPASVALKTVGLSALLMVEPPHAPSRPIRSTRATATASLSGDLRGASGGLLFTLALGREGTDRRHDLGVGQRRHVAEIPPVGDVAQQAPHDLARAGLRQVVGEDDRVGPGDLADLGRHVLPQLHDQRLVAMDLRLERDERHDSFADDGVGARDDGGLGHRRMVHERRLDLVGRQAVPGDVHHVVDAAEEPEVAVLVPAGAVAGHVDVRAEAAEVVLDVAVGIAVDGPELRRPGA